MRVGDAEQKRTVQTEPRNPDSTWQAQGSTHRSGNVIEVSTETSTRGTEHSGRTVQAGRNGGRMAVGDLSRQDHGVFTECFPGASSDLRARERYQIRTLPRGGIGALFIDRTTAGGFLFSYYASAPFSPTSKMPLLCVLLKIVHSAILVDA